MDLRGCYCNTSNFLGGAASSFLRTEVSSFVNNFIVSLIFCDIPGTDRKTYLPANPTAAKPRPVTMTALACNQKNYIIWSNIRASFYAELPFILLLGKYGNVYLFSVLTCNRFISICQYNTILLNPPKNYHNVIPISDTQTAS